MFDETIRNLLVLDSLPSQETIDKILRYPLLKERAALIQTAAFAEQALYTFRREELAALHTAIIPPKPRPPAVWSLDIGLYTKLPFIVASCGACHQTVRFGPPEPRHETIKGTGKFEGQGKSVVHPVTKSIIADAAQNVRWHHCAKTEFPPPALRDDWHHRLLQMLPEESK